MFGNIGLPELLLIFFVVLLLFGARRIPEVAQGLGRGIREFRKSMRDVEGDKNDGAKKEKNAEGDKS
jgi:sec-independent protein translocase protein TatA